MNKEDRYSHVHPLDSTIFTFSPYCCHTTQTLVIKPGKSNWLCYDATATKLPTDIVMNQVTPVNWEAPITFGHLNFLLYTDIYNTQVSHLATLIRLGMADVKACFCFGCIHADLTGAFGFLARGYFNLSRAMVFGSTALASSWELFYRSIKTLRVVYANQVDLVQKHQKYLDMITWADIILQVLLTLAASCNINQGTLEGQRKSIVILTECTQYARRIPNYAVKL